MAELTETILAYLDKNSQLNTLDYAKANNLDHQKVIGAIKSLQTHEGVSWPLRPRSRLEGYLTHLIRFKLLSTEQTSARSFSLNEEAEDILAHGSHEVVVYKAIPDTGIAQADLMVP